MRGVPSVARAMEEEDVIEEDVIEVDMA